MLGYTEQEDGYYVEENFHRSTETAAMTGMKALRQAIRAANRLPEPDAMRHCQAVVCHRTEKQSHIQSVALELVTFAREQARSQSGPVAFMREYDLSTQEGILLMCVAEALLRIPDNDTIDRLISDRLSRGEWDMHLGHSHSMLVNASTWGLLLTGRVSAWAEHESTDGLELLARLVAKSGSVLVRAALQQAVQLLARQFVVAENMDDALDRASIDAITSCRSYDCLGEAAQTRQDVERYFKAYSDAIEKLSASCDGAPPDSVSIKLSALHPRYEFAKHRLVLSELVPRLGSLAQSAAQAGVGLTLDAEEADRLELQLDIFEAVFRQSGSGGPAGFGIAVQACQKRALPVLHWLEALAAECDQSIPVRLVKGAYWDTEIKRAQEAGFETYPVYTRKSATDVSYLACAHYLLNDAPHLQPQFASHNAYTLAWVTVTGEGKAYELQRLQGMGEEVYAALARLGGQRQRVRVYTPVGERRQLLPYLVRRLLENGANTSFINQLANDEVETASLVTDPCQKLQAGGLTPHPDIPLPAAIYGEERANAGGYDLSDPDVLKDLLSAVQEAAGQAWQAGDSSADSKDWHLLTNPADAMQHIGRVQEADRETVTSALQSAAQDAPAWDQQGGQARADMLFETARLMEQQAPQLLARIVREGGRTLVDALAEVREAVDFCRYYGHQAKQEFADASVLPGIAGERNELRLHGRGVFACISPWNFPLAIFTGQVAAALAAGNAVLAKPARQTPLTAAAAVDLFHQAGVPDTVLQLLPGPGPDIGQQLCGDPLLSGIAFTGSTDTARILQRMLAARDAGIVPLIAETGGQNVMIADSSALPEQLVRDVLVSAFNSAGQRCSALRVLFIQEDIAAAVLDLLAGAMQELQFGDPLDPATDIGPVIDTVAQADLQRHIDMLEKKARLIERIVPPENLASGHYFPVQAWEIDSLDLLQEEVFGPVLHVIRYASDQLDAVVDAVNCTGYGLTLGVHSRIESSWQRVRQRARVGNLYINRNMIGAAVGRQPFGGEGLSGTGPKAGGPYYLHRFATERTCSINTAAVGGDAGLLSLDDL